MDSIERELQFGHIMSEFLPPRPFHSRQIPQATRRFACAPSPVGTLGFCRGNTEQ